MTAPWFQCPVEGWESIRKLAAMSGEPWSEAAVRTDLAWWADQVRVGRKKWIAGRRQLISDWGWTDHRVRKVLSQWWPDVVGPHPVYIPSKVGPSRLWTPRNHPSTTPRSPQHHPTVTPATDDGCGVFGENHPSTTPAPPQHHPTDLHTRTLTEQQSNRATDQEDILSASPPAAPAEPEPPAATAPEAEPEAPPGPLWQAMGLPKPGKGVPKSLLTQDVLDVWAYWLKVHTEYAKGRKGVGAPRVIGKGDLRAIQAGLRWQPESTAECPDGWTQKRVLCTVLAYAYRAPEDAPGASWWRRPDRAGSDLNPRTLLRLGQDPKLPRNAAWAVAWRLAGAAPTLTVVEGGKASQGATTAREIAERLWAEYLTADFENMGHRVAKHGVLGGLFRSWCDMTTQTVSMQELLYMRPNDRPFRKRDYIVACERWVRANLGVA